MTKRDVYIFTLAQITKRPESEIINWWKLMEKRRPGAFRDLDHEVDEKQFQALAAECRIEAPKIACWLFEEAPEAQFVKAKLPN